MQSTMLASNSDLGSGSEMGSNASGRSRPSRKQTQANLLAATQKAKDDEKMQKSGTSLHDYPLEIDETTGMQMMRKDLVLTFQQKLQIRIAAERKIDINTLRGDQFDVLKEFKKLEKREELLNNMLDFFDPKYESVTFSHPMGESI